MAGDVRFLVHTIVLPPKLPQKCEADRAAQEIRLIAFWQKSVLRYLSMLPEHDLTQNLLRNFSQTIATVHTLPTLDVAEIKAAVAGLEVNCECPKHTIGSATNVCSPRWFRGVGLRAELRCYVS